MVRRAILALDQGTTNTKAVLVDEDGEIVATASRPTGVSYPREGWAEQSAEAIWSTSVKVLSEVIAKAENLEILALGISNQRESIVVWDAATGKALGPCVIWQCLRSAPLCAELRELGNTDEIHEISGLMLDPLFSAGKLRWLIDHAPGAQEALARGALRAGTIDSWLLWNLTGGAVHATDCSNASRTQLLSLEAAQWSDRLCTLFGVPRSILPEVRASDSCFGVIAASLDGLPVGLPVHAILGDSQAALFGHGIQEVGRLKVTLGTGSSLMTPTATPGVSRHGLAHTIAWSMQRQGPTYALEGNIVVSGHAAAFAVQLLGLDSVETLTRLALTVPDNGGLCFIPALAGLSAPHSDESARGLICGMSLGTKPGHVARSVLEAIALQIYDVLSAMESELGRSLTEILVDGSATRNDVLMQILANITGRLVLRPANTDLSALGAARMAARAVGLDLPVRPVGEARTFMPIMSATERDAIRLQWIAAIHRAGSKENQIR